MQQMVVDIDEASKATLAFIDLGCEEQACDGHDLQHHDINRIASYVPSVDVDDRC